MKVQNKDSSTLCPVGGIPTELQGARVIKVNDKVLTVTGQTAYQMFFKGQPVHGFLAGSKAAPVEFEVTKVE